jgi:hypothetical protein
MFILKAFAAEADTPRLLLDNFKELTRSSPPSQEGNLAGRILSRLLEAGFAAGIETPLSRGGPPPRSFKVWRRRGVSPGNVY